MKYKVPFVNYPLQYRNLKSGIDAAITRVLENGDLILRSDLEEFERDIASFIGVRYAVGVSSGTDALIFSLQAAGIRRGDEVITVSHTFVASIASIVHVQAAPVLIDVKEDFTMDTDKIESAITPKTKAIIPVHLNGRMCDMNAVMALAERYHIKVIEDSAQALGAQFRGMKAGSFGMAGSFSFYPAKILGGYGDGGLVATNDKDLYEKILLLRSHGQKTKTEILQFGFTGRLDNIQAAILRVKLKHLPKWLERRRQIAKAYHEGLKGISNIILPPAPGAEKNRFDVYQNYVIKAGKRDDLAKHLMDCGVEILIKDPFVLHHQKNLKLSSFALPVTERLSNEVISLPIYPELADEQIVYVVNSVKDFYGA